MSSAMSFDQVRSNADAEWARFAPTGRPRILVGAATCGRAAGALEVLDAFRSELPKHGELAEATLCEVGCIGLCFAEVLVEVSDARGRRVLYRNVDAKAVAGIVESHLVGGTPVVEKALALVEGDAVEGLPRLVELDTTRDQTRVVLRNCGLIDPTNINHYVAMGGYTGLARALTMSPDEVIAEISASGLRGRGGAGFPTGRKWSLARKSSGDDKYVVCNADEGDPGAFMDRDVLESDPHAVLEGLAISGYAIGARTGYVYVRAEYPLAIERVQTAIAQMRDSGLLGEHVCGSDFVFDIEIRKGAGAFVCGEETSLMASIEGKRGMPRSRPPYPAVSGLFGKPTNINNVETLASVSAIMEKGVDWYSKIGTEKSRGTKTFALAGDITKTGLIEVPLGLPLKTIVDQIGGGVPGGKKLKAIQTGGPSGGCIPAKLIDLPVDYEHLAEVGSIMGSGGMVVMDENSCMVDVARYFTAFTENESCGKCVPCRMGTQHLLRILTDITEGRGTPDMLKQLEDICDTMKKGSLCALGGTAPNPVLTTLEHFMDEYRAHIDDKRCPAGVCRALITYSIDAEKCTGCGACRRACPVNAIAGEKKAVHAIDAAVCTRCGACRQSCRFGAVLVQ